MSFQATFARALERGRRGVLSSALASVWGSLADVERPLAFPGWARIIAVGGPVLGGSGKTPLAIAVAKLLHERGVSVAFVGHGYAARPERARVVRSADPVEEVGDEALVAARELSLPVVVAPSRQAAVYYALSLARVLVVDGMLQSRPVRCALSLLAVDADRPWGAGAYPPVGDLRAPISSLLTACDMVVPVRGVTRGAWLNRSLLSWNELRGLRVGLWTSVARPDRIVASLARHGVVPITVELGQDHHPPRPGDLVHPGIDLWLVSPKCAIHLPESVGRAPVAVIDHTVIPSADLVKSVSTLTGGSGPHSLNKQCCA